MSRALQAVLIAGIVLLIVGLPWVAYRDEYTYQKRLRVIVPGRLYRSGQMTAAGFRDAQRELGIRTVVNLQNDFPDPDIELNFWTSGTIKESELCRQLGVNYVLISPDLISRRSIPQERPRAIDAFLELMDDEKNYPVLIHCKAGLHRTGCLAAVYRMEYEGWSHEAALRELRSHGFGHWTSKDSNDYIVQYLTSYRPGLRRTADGVYVARPAPGTREAARSE